MGRPSRSLDFDGEQVEINDQKFDDLSITWNTVDPTQPVTGCRLAWRDDRPELIALHGQPLRGVDRPTDRRLLRHPLD